MLDGYDVVTQIVSPRPRVQRCWPGALCLLTTQPTCGAWLEAHPNITFHFTTVGPSWVNQIEIWFAIITKQAIRRGAFASVAAVIARIRVYVQPWNTTAEPFASRPRRRWPDAAVGWPSGRGGVDVAPDRVQREQHARGAATRIEWAPSPGTCMARWRPSV